MIGFSRKVNYEKIYPCTALSSLFITFQRERSASESDLRTSIKTPADLYDHFASKNSKSFEEVYPGEKQPILKSILKKDSQSNSNENLKLRPILKASPEHQPGTPEQVGRFVSISILEIMYSPILLFIPCLIKCLPPALESVYGHGFQRQIST